jgi:protein TonB
LVYLKGRDTTPEPTMNMSALTRPTNPLSAAAPSTTPPQASVPAEPAPAEAQSQTPPESISVEPAQPSARTLTPAIVSNAGTVDSHAEAQNSRRPEKSLAASKPAEAAVQRRPAIPNLKMSTPSAPSANLSNASEIAAPEAAASTTSAGLLTASGRASNPPVAPLSAPAPVVPAPVVPAPPAAKVVHAPTLISSTRPDYPATAKASRVQGDVSVLAEIDASGKVTGARALSGPLLLRQAAVDSVRQWKYAPGATDGKPSPSQVTVNITFRMN